MMVLVWNLWGPIWDQLLGGGGGAAQNEQTWERTLDTWFLSSLIEIPEVVLEKKLNVW